MTLRRRLLLTLGGVALLPVLVLSGLFSAGAVHTASRQGRRELTRTLDLLAIEIDRRLGYERTALQSLAADWSDDLVTAMPLVSWLARRPDLPEWFLGESPGHLLRMAVVGSSGVAWLEPAFRDGRVVVQPVTSPHESPPFVAEARVRLEDGDAVYVTDTRPTGPVVATAVRVPARGDAPASWLLTELDAVSLLSGVLGQSAFEQLGTWVIAAPAGGSLTILHHADPARIGLSLSGDPEWAALGSSHVGEGWSFERRGDRLLASGRHASTGWILGASLPLAPYLDPVWSSLRWTLIVIGLMAAMAVLGVLLVTRGIGRTVSEIAEGTSAIARGDLHRALGVRRSDEFGAIAEAINQMARDLVLSSESRSIARLSAGLVHELKGVASKMSLLLYNFEKRQDDAEFRSEFADLMRALIRQTEALALRLRAVGREAEPAWEEADVRGVVRSLLDRLRVETRPEIHVETMFEPCGPMWTNRDLLGVALENVVVNAIEAMPSGGGTLRVTAGPLPASKSGPTHVIEILDNGSGMSPEFVATRLFQPFVTTKALGIGLGMYQSREILRRLEGTIAVHSRPGEGTRVRIEVGRARTAS